LPSECPSGSRRWRGHLRSGGDGLHRVQGSWESSRQSIASRTRAAKGIGAIK
jgi:hypothetical protein